MRSKESFWHGHTMMKVYNMRSGLTLTGIDFLFPSFGSLLDIQDQDRRIGGSARSGRGCEVEVVMVPAVEVEGAGGSAAGGEGGGWDGAAGIVLFRGATVSVAQFDIYSLK